MLVNWCKDEQCPFASAVFLAVLAPCDMCRLLSKRVNKRKMKKKKKKKKGKEQQKINRALFRYEYSTRDMSMS